MTIGMCSVSGAVMAQSNVTGSIFGSVNPQQGTAVTVSSADTGFSRTIPVDSSGRYRFSSLPPGAQNGSATRAPAMTAPSGM